jgi:hypothetical protein
MLDSARVAANRGSGVYAAVSVALHTVGTNGHNEPAI